MNAPAIAWLYVPADRPDRISKALAGDADGVIVDLEDAVAPAAKDSARAGLAEALASTAGKAVQVRVNAVGTPWHGADLDAVAALDPAVGLRLPKCEDPAEVARVAASAPGRGLHLLIESALGVERAFELASAPQVASLGLGEADLRADLRATDEGLVWARCRVVNAARAAGLPSPLMSAFTHVKDLDGLAASCRAGRALGFLGRAAIHPAQIATIRQAFAPTDDEVFRARQVLANLEGSIEAGVGALQLADGTFLDVAMLETARQTIALARRSPK